MSNSKFAQDVYDALGDLELSAMLGPAKTRYCRTIHSKSLLEHALSHCALKMAARACSWATLALEMAARACFGANWELKITARACFEVIRALEMAARACFGANWALKITARACFEVIRVLKTLLKHAWEPPGRSE